MKLETKKIVVLVGIFGLLLGVLYLFKSFLPSFRASTEDSSATHFPTPLASPSESASAQVIVIDPKFGKKDLGKLVMRAPVIRKDSRNRIRRIAGLNIPLAKVGEKEIADFARDLADLLGPGPIELAREASRARVGTAPMESDGGEVYRVQQYFKGYAVLDGELRVTVHPATQSVSAIEASQIQHFSGDFVNESSPRDRIESELQLVHRTPFLPTIDNSPVVFRAQGDRPRLVYRFTPRPPGAIPLDWKELIVDAGSGEVLTTRNLVIAN